MGEKKKVKGGQKVTQIAPDDTQENTKCEDNDCNEEEMKWFKCLSLVLGSSLLCTTCYFFSFLRSINL